MNGALPSALAGLLSADAYPHPAATVELVETHISWVLLAGEHAYKIKRPVRYPFVDLTSLERRRFFCEEELRLNRRFAPDLYCGTCRVVSANGRARIEHGACSSAGEVIEFAVEMRRFSRAEELDRLLEARRIEAHELESFGRALAQIHARLPVAAVESKWGTPAEVHAQLIRNVLDCADASVVFGAAEEVLALRDAFEERLAASALSISTRRANGRVRECHGDLHCRNLVRIGGQLVAFDCLEYEPAFRWIDVADELAFLWSDLKARESPLHAQALRAGYLTESGDYHACRVLTLYAAHRALVRAKVAALSAAQNSRSTQFEALGREHVRLVEVAAEALAAMTPCLLLMSGLSGSGKSWLARQLAERLSAVHIRSDVERKRRAGLGETDASHARVGEGLYSSAASAALYEELACRAADVLGGGISVIVDATFGRRAQRTRFVELAADHGVPLRLIRCEAPEPVLRARIMERGRVRRDASEADLEVLAWQIAHDEVLAPDEAIERIHVDTERADALERTLRAISDCAAAAPNAGTAAEMTQGAQPRHHERR